MHKGVAGDQRESNVVGPFSWPGRYVVMSNQAEPTRPFPKSIDPLYVKHYEGLKRGEVLVPCCRDCKALQWPPRVMCDECHSIDFDQVAMPTRARVFSYVTVNRAFHPWFAARAPYFTVLGDFGNGVRMLGLLRDASADGVGCDQEVEVGFDSVGEFAVLEWRLADETAA
ncbi:Zn-ribbon domain-containing OB-fold protein [Microbacterium sp. A93]|uniref:Zn-ribbon domain-containing OB-fold protein n=1 Tax=Microbacterium sp. A93 TaxID=3450716 RepID=UPI003F429AE9